MGLTNKFGTNNDASTSSSSPSPSPPLPSPPKLAEPWVSQVRMYVHALDMGKNGHTNRKYPNSLGLCPLLGLLPKNLHYQYQTISYNFILNKLFTITFLYHCSPNFREYGKSLILSCIVFQGQNFNLI